MKRSIDLILNRWIGTPICSIPGLPNETQKILYLTFDDGPYPSSTQEILQILDDFHAPATFFVIANSALQYPALIESIQRANHSLGNHSLDHEYRNFFKNHHEIKNWILESEKILRQMYGEPTVGFRSPAGIRTPFLHQALRELAIPLIHWNVRFFDSVIPWTSQRATRSLRKTKSGSIILLHDKQEGFRKVLFLNTLKNYIRYAQELGFVFKSLNRNLFLP